MALVAGATRGAGRGIAVELGSAGATVYLTGRTTRAQHSEYKRPERAGGQGISMQVDHLDPAQVQALVARIKSEQSRLDILVNDVWGAELLAEWNVPVWKHSLLGGLRMLRLAIDTMVLSPMLGATFVKFRMSANQPMQLDTGNVTSPTTASSQRPYSGYCEAEWTELSTKTSAMSTQRIKIISNAESDTE